MLKMPCSLQYSGTWLSLSGNAELLLFLFNYYYYAKPVEPFYNNHFKKGERQFFYAVACCEAVAVTSTEVWGFKFLNWAECCQNLSSCIYYCSSVLFQQSTFNIRFYKPGQSVFKMLSFKQILVCLLTFTFVLDAEVDLISAQVPSFLTLTLYELYF